METVSDTESSSNRQDERELPSLNVLPLNTVPPQMKSYVDGMVVSYKSRILNEKFLTSL